MVTHNIVVAGVGGQGSILAAHILGKAAMREADRSGKTTQVRIGETYGAAMRGGKVFSIVRIGNVLSPLTREDGAEMVIGLEPLETLRAAVPYLSPNGICVVNTHPYIPLDTKMGRMDYPEQSTIISCLERLCKTTMAFDATALAQELGKVEVMNIIMIGAASALGGLRIDETSLVETIKLEVPSHLIDLNLQSFYKGREVAEKLSKNGRDS
jgi:indolepyruvate ferredoxin oxidoreductase, beta subunit